MKDIPNAFLFFLFATVLLLILIALIFFIPRIIKTRNEDNKNLKTDLFLDAFQSLGKEISSLKEQLVIKERLAALGEISAGIAHELRNPMGVIAGYAKLLLKSIDEKDGYKRDLIAGILKEIEEMNSFIEELLKFSRSEPIKKTDSDLTKVISNILETLEGSDRIIFSIKEPISIKADEILLKKALENLIKNGLEAGDKVWIEIKEKDKGVDIIIKDNGRGIPEEDQKRIFMPFFSTKEKGFGIGLALAQKIIMGHGGNIKVESQIGEGSTFKVFLPYQ